VVPVWTNNLEKSVYTFLTAFSLKYFPIFNGRFATGKNTTITEVARMLAQNLIIRPVTPMTTSEGLQMVKLDHFTIHKMTEKLFFLIQVLQRSCIFWFMGLYLVF